MAHKTLIDGTAYEITGGKTLIDGTAYSIKGGRTLIDGTGYDISFGAPLITFGLYDRNSITTYTHQAEEGMTWAEYCDSEYNTDITGYGTLGCGDNFVVTNTVTWFVTDDYVNVAPTDVIKADYTYILVR